MMVWFTQSNRSIIAEEIKEFGATSGRLIGIDVYVLCHAHDIV